MKRVVVTVLMLLTTQLVRAEVARYTFHGIADESSRTQVQIGDNISGSFEIDVDKNPSDREPSRGVYDSVKNLVFEVNGRTFKAEDASAVIFSKKNRDGIAMENVPARSEGVDYAAISLNFVGPADTWGGYTKSHAKYIDKFPLRGEWGIEVVDEGGRMTSCGGRVLSVKRTK